jgi:hypothetical protein
MQVLYPEAAAAAGGKGKESKASLTPARIARLDTIGAAELCPLRSGTIYFLILINMRGICTH